MSRFSDSVSTIISVFHKCAKGEGDSSKLSRRAMKKFIEREFADVIAEPHDPQTIDKILQFLEWDGDGELDLNEFLFIAIRVAKACYWYLPTGSCLLQKTKLTTSGKVVQEPEIENRGSRRQLQEEEPQTCASSYHPPREPELQRDMRVNKLETVEESGSYRQRNTRSRSDAKRGSEPGDTIPQVYEERSQEPRNQQDSQRRRQPPAPDRRDVQRHQRGGSQANEPRLQAGEGVGQGRSRPEQLADVRSRSQTREPQPLPNRWSRHHPHEPALPAYDQKNQQPQEADRGNRNQPQTPELLTEGRSRYQLRELEQKALERSSQQPGEPECLESRRPHQSYTEDPLESDHMYYETCKPEKGTSEKENQENETEYSESERERYDDEERDEQDDVKREEPVQRRRIDRQGELEVSESRSRRAREWEERPATTNQRQTRETEDDGRRQRESVRYERTRDTVVAAAEADVNVHRVSEELEPREDVDRRDRPREREQWEDNRRICREREREEPVRERSIDRQRELEVEVSERRSRRAREWEERPATTSQREDNARRQRQSVRYESTGETEAAAAEADVKVHRVSQELEPREDVDRRDRPQEREEPVDNRRICREREREEPVRERSIDRQRELEVELEGALEVSERRSRRTREREERPASTNQREDNARRQRESVRYERTRETVVAAAEPDVNVHRVSRELEPREDVDRRDRPREREEPEDNRRICREREREELVRERSIDRQRELEVELEGALEVSERRGRRAREWEERPATTNQREDNARRQRESVRYERTRDTVVAAAEADVNVHCVSQELEPREDVDRRDRPREREQRGDNRRICREREREEPVREKSIDHQRELEVELGVDLEVSERHSRKTREWEERPSTTNHRETCETEDDGRRQREPVRYERTRDTVVAAAEADINVHRLSEELEPREDVDRRDRPREREEPEDNRRICREREREEPVRERSIDRQRELEVEVSERRSRRAREWEERPASTNQREDNARRQRESVRYERTRDTVVAAAEADVNVHRVSRELEPREDVDRRDRPREREQREDNRRICREREREEPVREKGIDRQQELEVELGVDLEVSERHSRRTREWEERPPTTNHRETRETEDDGRRQRESVRYERTRDTVVAAAEADVNIHRVSEELEPREDMDRRDRPWEREEPEDNRRICRERERKELVRERSIDRQRELEVEVSERHSRRAREWEERPATTSQREDNARRQRQSVRYESTRETAVAAAEADVKVHRVSQELEPREDVDRRDRPREREQREDNRRICREREREEPVRERSIDRQRELELEVSERRSRRAREWEERPATTNQREDNARRQRESVRYERTRDTVVAAAEADVNVHRVSEELKPREDVDRRDRPREREQREDNRRICREREREEPVRERSIDRQRELELEVSERRSRRTREWEEQPATTNQREKCERRDCDTYDPEDDGRRQRLSVRYESTRETAVAAAEADVKVHRVSQELEPREDVDRRDRPREREEPEDNRRIWQEREREEPVRERSIDRRRELEVELEVSERRSRRACEWEERPATTNQRETRDRSSLETLKEQDNGILHCHDTNDSRRELCEIPCEKSSEDQERRNHRLLTEQEEHEPNRSQTRKDEGQRHERSLHQIVDVDNEDLCPPGEQASVSDLRVCYIPAEPDIRPEVRVLPQSCDPQTVAYLVHVIQNMNDPDAATYKIICHQPRDQGQPVYVKKCYVTAQLPTVQCDRSSHPEPRPQRDERETGEPEPPRQGDIPPASSQENTGDRDKPQEESDTGVKEGAHQASASEPDGVTSDPCQEERRDSEHPKMAEAEEEDRQSQGDGSKAVREQVPREPEPTCQEREDTEAKSCSPLPQAPEPREARESAAKESRPQPPRRDDASRCRGDEELPPPEKSRQPREVENSKRRPRQVRESQPQGEEKPRLCTEESQGPPRPPVLQEAPIRPAGDEAKAS